MNDNNFLVLYQTPKSEPRIEYEISWLIGNVTTEQAADSFVDIYVFDNRCL